MALLEKQLEKVNSTMNILIDLSFIRQVLYQGVAKYAYRFLDYIVEEKLYDNFTLLINTVSENEIRAMYPQFKYITIGPSIFKPIPIVRTIWTSICFNRTVNKGDFDIVFCPWANEITCLKTNKKVISVIHDFQLRKDTKGFILFLHKLIDNRIIKNSFRIVTISEFSKKNILKYYPETEKTIFNLGNSVSVHSKSIQRVIDYPYILFVGRISELKNIKTLLRAFVKIGNQIDQKLIIVGEKNKYWENELFPLITAAKLDEKVIIISSCSEEKLASLYRYADLFVFPSLREGFGSPPLEAAIMKTQVIVSYCESIPEVTMGLTHYYTSPKDANELAEKIQFVLQNPISDSELENIATVFYNNYNIHVIGERIFNFIKTQI